MDDRRTELVKYRLDKALKNISIADVCVREEDYETAANRSYYAMFHCVRALLALEGVDYKKHSAVVGHFRKEYVKTGLFEKRYSDYLGEAFDTRGKSDYEDFFIISKSDVIAQIEHAREFYDAVKSFLANRIDEK